MFSKLTERLAGALQKFGIGGTLTEKNIQDAVREIRIAFLEADVALPIVREFTEKVKTRAIGEQTQQGLTAGQTFIKIVREELEEVLGSTTQQLNLRAEPPAVIMLAGLQGVGKTTTAAKLAKLIHSKHKKRVLLLSTDTQRPAAIEQLNTLAKQLNIDCFPTDATDKPTNIVKLALNHAKLKLYEVLIVDTAGRLHVDESLMNELQQMQQHLNPIETLLVVDAMMGQDAANTAKAFIDKISITGIILSKADSDARGGAALSMRFITNKPIKFIGVGEKSDALEQFHPDRMASRILGMGDLLSFFEELEQKTDKKKIEEINKKVSKGHKFDFEDFIGQIKQMRSMGGIESLISKLPNNPHMSRNLPAQLNDKELTRMEAIINSMTIRERQLKDQIKGSRKRRIASGAGLHVHEVNKLLQQFEQMQMLAKKINSSGFLKFMQNFKDHFPIG